MRIARGWGILFQRNFSAFSFRANPDRVGESLATVGLVVGEFVKVDRGSQAVSAAIFDGIEH